MLWEKANNATILIKGLNKSKHDCFKKLFNLYSKPLYRFSINYLKSEQAAEDIVQEVFMKIWNKRKDINTNGSFQTYLFTIALNSIRKHFNKLAETNQLKHDILATFSQDSEKMNDADNYQDLLKKLEILIDKMPARRREIFLKKKIECKSLKEIADEYDITVKTVEYHITEAMKFLKKEFEKLQLKGMIFFCLFV
jgi:RNA polymerase sigma-70 factor (family 1)